MSRHFFKCPRRRRVLADQPDLAATHQRKQSGRGQCPRRREDQGGEPQFRIFLPKKIQCSRFGTGCGSRRGASVVTVDPPEVARALRVHRNSFDNTVPFLLLGFVFAALVPAKLEAQILFGVFTGARLLFSFAYLKGLQPWRTISFLVGVLTTLALTIEVCRLALS